MSRLWKAAVLVLVVAAAACSSTTEPRSVVIERQADGPAADVDTTAGPLCSGWSVVNGVVTCP